MMGSNTIMARSTFERGGTSGSVCGPVDESNAESSHARRRSNFINQDLCDPSKRPMITLDAEGFADTKALYKDHCVMLGHIYDISSMVSSFIWKNMERVRLLEEVIEVAYHGVGRCVMILFKCEIEEPVFLVIQGELEIVNNNGDDTQTELSDEAEQSDKAEFLDNSDESDDDSDDIFDESSDNE
ncbi:hypothetical protein Tco_0318946 [Tanacetum coccineum]